MVHPARCAVALLVLIGVGSCGPAVPEVPPAKGWQQSAVSVCESYGARFVLHEQRLYCRRERVERVAGFKRTYWTLEGPFEGDLLGVRARGWYLREARAGGWSFVDDEGVVRAEGRYEHGRHGVWTIRYASGQVASEVRYDRHRRDGEARWWYEDGTPWWRGQYRDGKPVGVWTHRDRAGRERSVDAKRDAVGPLTHPVRVSGRGIKDDECPASGIADYLEAIRAGFPQGDPAKGLDRDSQGRLLVRRTDDGTTLHRSDGAIAGRMAADGASGEIWDENGLLVFRQRSERGADGVIRNDLECYDEGGRRIGTHGWHDPYAAY